MSWSFSANGKPDAVKQLLEQYQVTGTTQENVQQFSETRDFVKAQLNKMGDRNIKLEMYGHSDSNHNDSLGVKFYGEG